jgi:hypothetical protein
MDFQLADNYVATAETLKARIMSLIPTNPAILEMESAWDLFDVPGFDCSDLGPSGAQASWALSSAVNTWKAMREAAR